MLRRMQFVSKTQRHYFNYAAVILSGFLIALLIGTCLLMLPLSTAAIMQWWCGDNSTSAGSVYDERGLLMF